MIMARIKLWLAAAGAFLIALGAAYWRGRSTEAAAAERERLDGYVETRKRIDEVDLGDDPDMARRFLHERGKR
jgi:hypothetical protein